MITKNLKNRFCSDASSETLSINVLNSPRYLTIVKKAAITALKSEGFTRADLSLYFVSDPQIRRLNRKYLSKNSYTDVLSFDLSIKKIAGGFLSGDIVVSIDTAKRVSKKLGIAFEEELCRYVIHGILHLTGYDDLTVGDRSKMWKRQEFLLRKCKLLKS